MGGFGGGGDEVDKSSKPYLAKLSKAELDKLGLKAVAAGAQPMNLQQAFAVAKTDGDWAPLENEIAAFLGSEAITDPNASGNPLAQRVPNVLTNLTSK